MNPYSVRTRSRPSLALLGVLFILATLEVLAQAGSDAKSNAILVLEGTAVHLVLMDDLQGKQLQAKQTVHFKVREDG